MQGRCYQILTEEVVYLLCNYNSNDEELKNV